MEQNYSNQQQPQYTPQLLNVPNSTGVLVLGILSIVTFMCYGIVGIILAIIALILAKSGTAEYNANPQKYSLTSFNNLKAGKICAIIGLALSCLMLLYIIFIFAFIGSILGSLPWNELNGPNYY